LAAVPTSGYAKDADAAGLLAKLHQTQHAHAPLLQCLKQGPLSGLGQHLQLAHVAQPMPEPPVGTEEVTMQQQLVHNLFA
jgi:hypothetical protein